MFLAKNLIAPLLFPLPLCVELLGIGLLLLWFSRRQKAGKIIITTGFVLLLLLSNRPFSVMLLSPLEDHFPPLTEARFAKDQSYSAVKFIVVLGGPFTSDPWLPVMTQLGDDTLARLVEGIRIYRRLPGSKILLSGGKVFDPVPAAVAADQARLIQPMVGAKPMILITSAAHMPRAMALFRKRGMNPIPDPTDYLVKRSQEFIPQDLVFPSPSSLKRSTRAFHECLGLAWERLRGQI